MAVVSLIALLAALAVAALVSLLPWAPSSVAPQLGLAPGLGVGLDGAVALPPDHQLAVAPARPARSGGPELVADPATAGDDASAPSPTPAVAPARAVSHVAIGRPPASPQSPTPQPAPLAPPSPSPPSSSPAPATVPVAAPAPSPSEPAPPPPGRTPIGGGHSGGPGMAGGPVEADPAVPIAVSDGDELAISFLFRVAPTAYLLPGEENLILRLGSEVGEQPSLGLQLWDDGSGEGRGLWSSGEAMDGERFLAPLSEGAWHRLTIYLQASSSDDGFYLLTLDGEPIEARAWVSLIESEGGSAQLEVGLFRNGERVDDPTDVIFGPVMFGESPESV